MRIVVVSDTHGRHDALGALEGDVLIHCGDFGIDDASALRSVDAWFSRQRFAHILCTGGNHDFHLETLTRAGRSPFRHATFLQDESVTIGGLRFHGAPWVPQLAQWAYHLDRREIAARWQAIPADTDVLITHTPPLGCLDRTSGGRACGCPALRERIDALHLKLHCFGHVHASAGRITHGSATLINASIEPSAGRAPGLAQVIELAGG